MNEIIDFHQYAPVFDLEGGPLCLDFANTLDWHASQKPQEQLNSYADIVAWGYEAGLYGAEAANQLARLGLEQPAEAASVLEDARALREAVYNIFVAAAQGAEIPAADLNILTRFWRMAAQRLRLAPSGAGVEWDWQLGEEDLGRVLWHVTRSAVDLLLSDQRERVGQCEDDRGCGFLFLDTSRNRSRRWCSMESCGNRAKAHRHYARGKSA